MPRIGELDTDSEALKRRLDFQETLSAFDLNAWIFSLLPPQPGQSWLDLGCGRGKQTMPLLEAGCSVTAVDLSAASLAAIPGHPKLTKVEASLDNLALDKHFDRAVGSYSLYYANDPERLFKFLGQHVGAIVFCGPGHDNNRELRELTGKTSPTEPAKFMEEIAPQVCSRHFSRVEAFRFENEVRFPTGEAVRDYWRSHNLFDPSFKNDFPDGFVNTKRGVAIVASQ